MGVRKQRATTKDMNVDNNIDTVIKKGKLYYRNYTNEFYIFETCENSGFYFPDSSKLNDKYIQHWKFNDELGKWQIV